ncbi:MAG: phage major tail protein, TP901-1 family [Clostridium sp.]
MTNQAKRGLDLMMYVGETPIGGQRGASIEMTSETLDVSTKTTGDWTAKINGAKSWTSSCEGIYFLGDTGYKAAVDAFIAGTSVTVKLSDNGKTIGYTGQAIITSLSIDAPYDDALTYSLEFEGVGALTEIHADIQ